MDDRKPFRLRLYAPREENANPYYPSNRGLKNCIEAALEIFSKEGGGISRRIFRILRIAGGQRNPILNDTEIDFSVLLAPDKDAEADPSIKAIQDCAAKHGVMCTFLEG